MRDSLKRFVETLRPFNTLAGVFESDRGFHEGQAAQAIIDHLADREGWRVKTWEPRPKRNANPDFVVVREDGRRVGIEVRELIDPDWAKQMRLAKKHGDPIPLPHEWDAASLEEKIRADLLKKDQKLPTWGGRLDEYLVAEYTDEALISSQLCIADAAMAQMAPVACSLVTKAFFLLLYVPKSAGPRPRLYEIPIRRRSGSVPEAMA